MICMYYKMITTIHAPTTCLLRKEYLYLKLI